jgi:hypothetical protein
MIAFLIGRWSGRMADVAATSVPGPRFKVEVEVEVEVLDAALLERAALARIREIDYVDDGDGRADAQRLEEEEAAGEGPEGALLALVEPFDLVPEGAGVEVVASTVGVAANGRPPSPDFAALVELCRCGREECGNCAGFQLTPRTVSALWNAAQVLADQAYDDVEANGDDPVGADGEWYVFDRYPRITFARDAVWRRQAARCFDDLADDLAAGRWPSPTCPGEEMALHLMLRDAAAGVADERWPDDMGQDGGQHPDDYDWELAAEVLFQDSDLMSLFDESLDGIADPDSDPNRLIGMGDYRSPAWFRTFRNMPARDGRRPFRR